MKELLDILYEDEILLVLNKPCGLLTTAPIGIDSLEARVQEYIRWREHRKDRVYVGIVHRLDRPASGVMVVAKNAKATRYLASQFQSRTVHKTYWALVEGTPAPNVGEWRDYVRKIPDHARAEIVEAAHPDAKEAVLRYTTRDTQIELGSWLEIALETGRTHQIRIQSSSRLHPILGDESYGSSVAFGPPVDSDRERHIALHARRLEFEHPKTEQRMHFDAPLDCWWPAP